MKSQELKGRRVAKGLSQEKIAEMIGIGHITYNRKENDITPFTTDEIAKITPLLGLSVEDVNQIFFDGKLTIPLTELDKTA